MNCPLKSLELNRLESCFPYFQPIIDISTGSITGYECLARTYDMDKNIISAGYFFQDPKVPLQYRITIDRAVRFSALKRFSHEPGDHLIFINISPVWIDNLPSSDETPTIKMVGELGLNPENVVIEITESIGDMAHLSKMVQAYKAAGFKVAIDDFGAGYSQVDRLVALNPDYIKIDMEFFKDASRCGQSAQILLAISSLTEKSQCKIICEGVETEEEYHFALECGANLVQGWLFSPANENFLVKSKFQSRVEIFQRNYILRKRAKKKSLHFDHVSVLQRIKHFVALYLEDKLSKVDFTQLQGVGVIRYFICNREGRQLSPTYQFIDESLELDRCMQGRYRTQRPYVEMLTTIDSQSVTHSSRNHLDHHTKRLCQTYMDVLSDDQVIMVDYLSQDDTLYCQAS